MVLLIALLHTPPARRFALRQVVGILGNQGIRFNSSELDYNLLQMTATLHDVEMRSTAAPDLPPVLRAGRVHLDLSLRKLLGGELFVEDANIRNPEVHVVIDKDGRDNLPHNPQKKDQQTGQTEYLIDQALIEGGRLTYEDRRQQIRAALPLSSIRIDGNPLTGNHEIQLDTRQPGEVMFESRTLPLRNVNANILLEKDAVDVRRFQLALGDSTVALNGRINNFSDPRFDVKADTALSLGSLVQFAGLKQTVAGNVHVALAAQGPLAQMKATAKIDGNDLTLDRLRDVDLKAEAEYNLADSRLRLPSLNVTSPAGTIQGNADVALKPGAGQSTAHIATRGLDLGLLSSTFRAPVRIASRANATVEARWPDLDFEKASGNATVQLTATRRDAAKDVVPVSGNLNVRTAGNRIVLGIQNLQTLDAAATGTVEITNRRTLGGNIRVVSNALGSTLASAERFLGSNITDTPIEGHATVTARLGGTVQNPTFDTNIEAPELQLGQLKAVNIAANANYNGRQLELRNVDLKWQGQTITASGTVETKGRNPRINLTTQTRNVKIETVLAGLNQPDIPATGDVTLDAKITGTTKQPVVETHIAGDDLQAYGEQLGTLRADATVRGDAIEIPNLTLEKPQPGGDGSLRAAVTYNQKTRDYSIDARSRNIRLTDLTLPDGRAVRGAIDLTVTGQGNVKDPAGRLQLAARDLTLGDMDLGGLTASANVANGQAVVNAGAPQFNLSADATIGTAEPYPARFEIRADNTDIASLPVKIEAPIKGTVTAVVRGTADLKSPEQGQATVEVAALNLDYNGQPIRTEGPLVASYGNQRLTIERGTIVARDSRVSLEGTLPLDEKAGTGAIRLNATLDVPSLMQYAPGAADVTARGTATIAGTITGTLKRIDPDLTIGVKDGYLTTPQIVPPVANLNVDARVRNGALELNSATADLGPASFSASGTVPFGLLPADLPVELPRRQGPAQFTAELRDVDLGTLHALPEDVSGTVSARLEASASRPELEAVTGKLTFPTLRFQYRTVKMEQKGTSEIALANGTARVEQFTLAGPGTELTLAGTAGLMGARPLDLRLEGSTNVALLAAFADDMRAEGATKLQIALTGTATQPKARGFVELADATVSMRQPRIGIEGLDLRVDLDGTRATISRLDGSLNGGTLSGGGTVDVAGGNFRTSDLAVKATDVYLDFPEGLKTLSDIELTARNGSNGTVVLGGQVVVQDGGFTDDLNFDRGLLAVLNGDRGVDFKQERSPLLEKLMFNIGVRTVNPIVVNNNLAQAELTADLRVLGNRYEPGLSGRVTLEEGSTLRLQEREYVVERGVITFTNERRIEPLMDILATTQASGYDVRLQISGESGRTETTLTSDPPLPEPDILALLLTGKTMDEIRGQEFEVARNQVLSYLTGRVGAQIGRGIAGATGLSRVRIEPNLIAAETDPSARLTVGQDITRNLELIYSMDLINSSDQIYVAEYDISRRFTTRGVRQADGSFRMDFRHDVRFGGTAEPRRGDNRVERRIGNVSIVGEKYFDELKIADKLNADPGKKYDFFKVRKGVDRVQKMYTKADLLESRIRLRRQQEGQTVDLTLNVRSGPVVQFVFEGISVPGSVQKRVKEIWADGVFDTQRAEEAVEAVRAWLVKENRLRPQIEYRILTPAEGRKNVVFDIQPGPVFHDVELAFDGAKQIEQGDLRDVIESQKLSTDVYTAPGRVSEILTAYYHEMGYLDANVQSPAYELDAQKGTGRVVFPVTEGPLFRIGSVEFTGNAVYSDKELLEAVPLPIGEPWRPILREHAIERLRQHYWDIGFNDVETQFVLNRGTEPGTLKITFQIAEHRQSVVREIVVRGRENTSENLVRTQLEVADGDFLDLARLAKSRRNLYTTGAYSMVEIAREEIGGDAADENEGEKAIRLVVNVREIQPFELRYGGFFDTERGPGGIVDLSNRNSLGSARVLGFRGRYDQQLQEARIYFSQPMLRRFPLKTIASPYLRLERNPATTQVDPFNVDRVGFSLQQESTFRRYWLLNYGYRIERSRTWDPLDPTNEFDVRLRIAGLTSALTRDSRDDILDATTGSFFSQALQWSPSVLGSQVRFAKYFGQYFRYIPLQKPHIQLFTNKVERPRLVYAAAARIGLARGFGGQSLPLAERFFAGGSTTLRGFEQNSVGPQVIDGEPTGGQAMLVLNNELRFPLVSIFDGVGFVDVGNVYARVSDFSFADIRKAGGVGLRVRTPWFLLRLDYGIKLDRREGEPRSRLFFSIGQAF